MSPPGRTDMKCGGCGGQTFGVQQEGAKLVLVCGGCAGETDVQARAVLDVETWRGAGGLVPPLKVET